jgi:hypothetical protein
MGRMNAQSFIVGLIVGAAVFAVLRRLWRSAKGESEAVCDKCGDMKVHKDGKA